MRRLKDYQFKDFQSRMRSLVELEFGRFLTRNSVERSEQTIVSFAIEATRANTRPFLGALHEPEVIALLGGRTADSYLQELSKLLSSPPR